MKIILMAILALSLLSVGDVVQAATPDASSGATVAVSDTNGVIWTSENKKCQFSQIQSFILVMMMSIGLPSKILILMQLSIVWCLI